MKIVLMGVLVNVRVMVEYICSLCFEVVILVRMGWKVEENIEEDDVCV